MFVDREVHALSAGQFSQIISGTSFLVVGMLSLAVAAFRRRSSGAMALLWVGVWSAIYGIQRLDDVSALVALLPLWLQACVPYVHACITYLTLVAGALTFRELTSGRLRQFLSGLVAAGLIIAILGVGAFLRTGNENTLLPYNQILATASLAVLLVFLTFHRLGHKSGLIQDRGVMFAGCLLFCVEALGSNAARTVAAHLDTALWDDFGFAALLLSLGYVALHRLHADGLRLSAIDNELAMARQLQFSILPASTPKLHGLCVAAVYKPMTEVAGDFYEFQPAGAHRCGFLVADVSGHGVPAALIASMIKVAAKSVAAYASDPAELLRRLRDILSDQLQGQFVSVAYLWIDSETGRARYSAAGHPPLLFYRAAHASLERIASNGTLIGLPFALDFPVCDFSFSPGDRFLLYTDGLTEPESATGEPFGENRLEQLVRDHSTLPAQEIATLLLTQLRSWQPDAQPQQDDITLVVIDAFPSVPVLAAGVEA